MSVAALMTEAEKGGSSVVIAEARRVSHWYAWNYKRLLTVVVLLAAAGLATVMYFLDESAVEIIAVLVILLFVSSMLWGWLYLIFRPYRLSAAGLPVARLDAAGIHLRLRVYTKRERTSGTPTDPFPNVLDPWRDIAGWRLMRGINGSGFIGVRHVDSRKFLSGMPTQLANQGPIANMRLYGVPLILPVERTNPRLLPLIIAILESHGTTQEQ